MTEKLKKIIFDRNKGKTMDSNFEFILESRYKVSPYIEAMKITITYGIVGAVWILLSDEILRSFVSKSTTYMILQTYKGWLYVIVTMIIIYFLIRNRLILFQKALKKIYESYEDLNSAHDELISLEEELRLKLDELEKNQEFLRQERQFSESIINDVSIIIIIWDKDGNIINFNPFSEKVTGYTKEEVIGKPLIDKLIPLEDRANIEGIVQNLKRGEGVGVFENKLFSKDGRYIDVLWNNSFLYDKDKNLIGIMSIGTDITERKSMEKKLQLLAYYDTLTMLPNRAMFEISMNKLIHDRKNLKIKFALIYMDIDNFKHINDTLGHASGDLLLKYISNILKAQVNPPDFAARLSGDEFVIIFDNIVNKEEIANRIDDLLKHLRRPWILKNQEFFISYSMGVTIYPDQGEDLYTLLKNADTAMFAVKENNKDNYGFYTDEMHEKTLAYFKMVNELRHAIKNEEFVLFYQPLVDLRDGKIVGVEALVRWLHKDKGLIFPMKFIPLAEETGYINDIGTWVIKTACEHKKEWEEKGYPPIKMSVNLSGKRITSDDLINEIDALISAPNTSCSGLQIEITETAVMKDINKAIIVLTELRNKGISIALDDFGTGYSSLTYLKNLPIDCVKMDKDFINNISSEDENEVIVKSVMQLIHDLNLEVVAEGVETKEQLAFLKKHGCDVGQGYLFSKPVQLEEIESLLSSGYIYKT